MQLQARVHKYALHWLRIVQRRRKHQQHAKRDNDQEGMNRSSDIFTFERLSGPFRSQHEQTGNSKLSILAKAGFPLDRLSTNNSEISITLRKI